MLAAATADLARRGVLVAHSDAFEALAKATHVLWDKTGTLTHGLVRVEEIRPLREMSSETCFALAVGSSAAPSIRSPGVRRGWHRPGRCDRRPHRRRPGIEGTVDAARLRVGTRDYAAARRGSRRARRPTPASWVYLGDAQGSWPPFA